MARIPSVKETTKDDGFWHVRFRAPKRCSQIRTPDWAEAVCNSVRPDCQVRMCHLKRTGSWKVQSVLVPAVPGMGAKQARTVAERIVRVIETGEEA